MLLHIDALTDLKGWGNPDCQARELEWWSTYTIFKHREVICSWKDIVCLIHPRIKPIYDFNRLGNVNYQTRRLNMCDHLYAYHAFLEKVVEHTWRSTEHQAPHNLEKDHGLP